MAEDLTFAMGQLAGQSQALANEVAHLRDAHDALPAKIVALLDPRFSSMDGKLADHETRLRGVEARDWKVYGGSAVILAIVGVIVGGWHPIHIPFLR